MDSCKAGGVQLIHPLPKAGGRSTSLLIDTCLISCKALSNEVLTAALGKPVCWRRSRKRKYRRTVSFLDPLLLFAFQNKMRVMEGWQRNPTSLAGNRYSPISLPPPLSNIYYQIVHRPVTVCVPLFGSTRREVQWVLQPWERRRQEIFYLFIYF